jgi:lysophospholipase L1-like esterase
LNKRYRLAYLLGVLLLGFILIISTAALLVFVKKASSTQYPAELSLSKHAYPNAQAIRVMPLGDSITFGLGTSDLGGYREPLWHKIEADNWNIRFVGSVQSGPKTLLERADEGHPGWRIDQISAKIVPWLQATQPQIILLHIGTNDIIQGATPELAESRLHYLLNQITVTDPSATVIVAQIIPLERLHRDPAIVAFNNTIPALVHTFDMQGKHVSYVDMYRTVPRSDLVDGIHPDAQGYALMADVWYHALKPLIMQRHAALQVSSQPTS